MHKNYFRRRHNADYNAVKIFYSSAGKFEFARARLASEQQRE